MSHAHFGFITLWGEFKANGGAGPFVFVFKKVQIAVGDKPIDFL